MRDMPEGVRLGASSVMCSFEPAAAADFAAADVVFERQRAAAADVAFERQRAAAALAGHRETGGRRVMERDRQDLGPDSRVETKRGKPKPVPRLRGASSPGLLMRRGYCKGPPMLRDLEGLCCCCY